MPAGMLAVVHAVGRIAAAIGAARAVGAPGSLVGRAAAAVSCQPVVQRGQRLLQRNNSVAASLYHQHGNPAGTVVSARKAAGHGRDGPEDIAPRAAEGMGEAGAVAVPDGEHFSFVKAQVCFQLGIQVVKKHQVAFIIPLRLAAYRKRIGQHNNGLIGQNLQQIIPPVGKKRVAAAESVKNENQGIRGSGITVRRKLHVKNPFSAAGHNPVLARGKRAAGAAAGAFEKKH